MIKTITQDNVTFYNFDTNRKWKAPEEGELVEKDLTDEDLSALLFTRKPLTKTGRFFRTHQTEIQSIDPIREALEQDYARLQRAVDIYLSAPNATFKRMALKNLGELRDAAKAKETP